MQKLILVADTPDGQARVHRALAGNFALQFASTMREAEERLIESETSSNGGSKIAMLIVGVKFDDSRMFDLLRSLRIHDYFDKIPFLVVVPEHNATRMNEGTKQCSKLLGACAFLELRNLTDDEASSLLLETVEASLCKTVELVRTDTKRSDNG